MKKLSRTQNTIRNSYMSILGQVISALLSFLTRTIFIKFLSIEYLGISGLYTNILTVLSLAELGVSTSIAYSLYKPIAEEDKDRICKLMNLYRRFYTIIGLVVAGVGLSLVPFLHYLIKDQITNLGNIKLYYIFYLANSTLSYFFAYKQTILFSNQKDYQLSIFRIIFNVIKAGFQISLLYIFPNFLIYLTVQIACTLGENITISVYVDKYYPYLKNDKKSLPSKEEQSSIFKNVKALMLYKIGGVFVDGTDNVLLTSIVNGGLSFVGLLSNYTLIVSTVVTVISKISCSITASVGNYVVLEAKEKQIDLLKAITMVLFWMYGFCSICLLFLLNPFVKIWLGSAYTFSIWIVLVIVLNNYLEGMMQGIWTMRSTLGLFVYGRYRPIVSAIVNIIVSVVLAHYIGAIGILIGTTITRLTTNVWFDPYIIYKYGFKENVFKYYGLYLLYAGILIFTAACVGFLIYWLPDIFVLKMVVCASVPNILFFIFFHRTKSFLFICKRLEINVLKKFKRLNVL